MCFHASTIELSKIQEVYWSVFFSFSRHETFMYKLIFYASSHSSSFIPLSFFLSSFSSPWFSFSSISCSFSFLLLSSTYSSSLILILSCSTIPSFMKVIAPRSSFGIGVVLLDRVSYGILEICLEIWTICNSKCWRHTSWFLKFTLVSPIITAFSWASFSMAISLVSLLLLKSRWRLIWMSSFNHVPSIQMNSSHTNGEEYADGFKCGTVHKILRHNA